MSAPSAIRNFKPGERVRHPDLGEGVVIAAPVAGFIKIFFPSGERQVPLDDLVRFARVCRVEKVMRPYLESLT